MEEHIAETEHKKPGKVKNAYIKPVAITLGAILIVVLSFTVGAQFEKHHNRAGAARKPFAQDDIRGGGERQLGGLGTVTAISGTSITIKNNRTSATSTYSITDSTRISNNGANATINDIKTGDTVMVHSSTTDTNTAAEIEINPHVGSVNSDDLPDSSDSTAIN